MREAKEITDCLRNGPPKKGKKKLEGKKREIGKHHLEEGFLLEPFFGFRKRKRRMRGNFAARNPWVLTDPLNILPDGGESSVP